MYVSIDGGEVCGDCAAAASPMHRTTARLRRRSTMRLMLSYRYSLAKEADGLRIVVIALASFISACMVKRLRCDEVCAGVEVNPFKPSRRGTLDIVHQQRRETLAAMLGDDIKTLALG